jgi:hypothetical protein
MNNGNVIIMEISKTTKTPNILKTLEFETPTSCINLFKDDLPVSPFPTVAHIPTNEKPLAPKVTKADQKLPKKETKQDLDYGDDMDLYGDDDDEPDFILEDVIASAVEAIDVEEIPMRKTKTQFWFIMVDDKGILTIYSLPDLKIRFKFDDFRCGHKFVNDQYSDKILSETGKYQSQIEEILICPLGADIHRSSTFIIVFIF